MKAHRYSRLAAVVMVCVLPYRAEAQQMEEKPTNDLAALGAKTFGIRWEGRVVGATERDVMAVTDGVTTLTTRHGSRIFILHNRKRFPPSEHMAFSGSDAGLKRIAMRLLLASGAKEDEIADIKVLQQFTQSGEAIPGSNALKLLPPQRSLRTLVVSRRISGVDVVSSRLTLNLDHTGQVAFLELAWPDISREVLERALHYQKLIVSGYKAPPLDGAEVEATEPVVLHSPAVGFYDDATAAIRVIYRPIAKEVGQKAVRYVDERGDDVKLPRDVDPPHEEATRRVEAKN